MVKKFELYFKLLFKVKLDHVRVKENKSKIMSIYDKN